MNVKTAMLAMALFFALHSGSCSLINQEIKTKGSDGCISVDEALLRKQQLKGTIVTVCGLMKYDFEDKNLYATTRSARDQSGRRCLAVGKAGNFSAEIKDWSGRRVAVKGQITDDFCPVDTICPSACSDTGIFVTEISEIR